MIILNEFLSCPDGYKISPTGDCKIILDNPSSGTKSKNNSSQSTLSITKVKLDNQSSSGSTTAQSFLVNISQSYCSPTNANCPPPNLTDDPRCPDGSHINKKDEICYSVIPCDSSKKKCPTPYSILKGECKDGIRCKNGYHMNLNDGLCYYQGLPCTLPKDQCPHLTYDPIPNLDQPSSNNNKTKETSYRFSYQILYNEPNNPTTSRSTTC
jgi:hypothetical protein